MVREVVRQRELNSRARVGQYQISRYVMMDHLMVQSIIDKYISLKFEHLAKGDILREQYTGEVRLILRNYSKAKYSGTSSVYDIIIASTGWRITPELIQMIEDRVRLDPNYYNLLER